MPRIAKPQASDLIMLILVEAIWGSSLTAVKMVVDDLGPLWTAAARVGVGFASVLPFFLFRLRWPKSREIWLVIALVALLNMVIPFVLISWAMKHIDAGVGALLLGTTPFIAMVMGHFLTSDERITPFKVLAVFLAVTGIAILAGADALLGMGSAALLAQLAVILGGACYVSAGFLMRRLDLNPIAFTAIALGLGTIMLIALSWSWEGLPSRWPEGSDFVALLWLGVLPTGLAYVLRYFLVRRVGVSTFALAMNTVPVFGIIIAAFVLGEAIEWSTLLALGLVLTGLMVARVDPSSKYAVERPK